MLLLADTTNPGLNIRQVINLLIAVQGEKNSPQVPWAFFGKDGKNMSFEDMKNVIVENIMIIKNDYVREKKIELK